MATATSDGMLDPDEDLRDIDDLLLDYLRDGRISPVLASKLLEDDVEKEYSRGYIQERLARFVEHDHAKNVEETGLYELTNDPYGGTDADEGAPIDDYTRDDYEALLAERDELRERVEALEEEREVLEHKLGKAQERLASRHDCIRSGAETIRDAADDALDLPPARHDEVPMHVRRIKEEAEAILEEVLEDDA